MFPTGSAANGTPGQQPVFSMNLLGISNGSSAFGSQQQQQAGLTGLSQQQLLSFFNNPLLVDLQKQQMRASASGAQGTNSQLAVAHQQQLAALQQQYNQQHQQQQREREQREKQQREAQLKREQQQRQLQMLQLQQQQQKHAAAAAAAAATAAASAPTTNSVQQQQQQLQNMLLLLSQHQQQQQQSNRMLQPNTLLSQIGGGFQTSALQSLQSLLGPSVGGLTPQLYQQYQMLLRQQQQQAQSAQPAVSNVNDERRRPSLMSNFHQTPQLSLNLLKPETKANQFGSLTSGVPLRASAHATPASSLHSLVAQSSKTNTSDSLRSGNASAAQLEEKREKRDVRDMIDKTDADIKILESQIAATAKRKQQLQQLMKHRRDEIEREREEAEAEAAARRAAEAKAEASKNKETLIERILAENDDLRTQSPRTEHDAIPPSDSDTSDSITERYMRIGPKMIERMTIRKILMQQRLENYSKEYDEKYMNWSKKVEKSEKAPKKVARDQKQREIFEKVFPDIKREREDRERNERHERIQQAAQGVIKTKEEKAAERACYIPMMMVKREPYEFKNSNTILTDEYLQKANENISAFVNSWKDQEKQTFNEKIRLYGKNFHALSHFYWDKTARDMVKFYYSTKSEMKYKLYFPKGKKKIPKSYKPMSMPDFREMFDHLMKTCHRVNIYRDICCIICDGTMRMFTTIPPMINEKERLYKKILKEQDMREKMPICGKCFTTYKKTAIRCPVGACPGGKRKQKPSRAPPTEFFDQTLDAQCAIVRKLKFHPASPKVCSNCYKRIQNEIENLDTNPFLNSALPVPLQKRRPRWSSPRVRLLLELVAQLGRKWVPIAQKLSDHVQQFRPSPRNCRSTHDKLRVLAVIRRKRRNLDKTARKIVLQYRKLRYRQEQHRPATENPEESPDIEILHEVKPEQLQVEKVGSITRGTPLPTDVSSLKSSNLPGIEQKFDTAGQINAHSIDQHQQAQRDGQPSSAAVSQHDILAPHHSTRQVQQGVLKCRQLTFPSTAQGVHQLIQDDHQSFRQNPYLIPVIGDKRSHQESNISHLVYGVPSTTTATTTAAQPNQTAPLQSLHSPAASVSSVLLHPQQRGVAHKHLPSDEESISLILSHFRIRPDSPNWREKVERRLQQCTDADLQQLQNKINMCRVAAAHTVKPALSQMPPANPALGLGSLMGSLGVNSPGLQINGIDQRNQSISPVPKKPKIEEKRQDENLPIGIAQHIPGVQGQVAQINDDQHQQQHQPQQSRNSARPNRKTGLSTAIIDQSATKRPSSTLKAPHHQLFPAVRPNSTPGLVDEPVKLKSMVSAAPAKTVDVDVIQHEQENEVHQRLKSDSNYHGNVVKPANFEQTSTKPDVKPTGSAMGRTDSINTTESIYEELSDSDTSRPESRAATKSPSENRPLKKLIPEKTVFDLNADERSRLPQRAPLLRLPELRNPIPGRAISPAFEDLSD